jgi:hypothetical protein
MLRDVLHEVVASAADLSKIRCSQTSTMLQGCQAGHWPAACTPNCRLFTSTTTPHLRLRRGG